METTVFDLLGMKDLWVMRMETYSRQLNIYIFLRRKILAVNIDLVDITIETVVKTTAVNNSQIFIFSQGFSSGL